MRKYSLFIDGNVLLKLIKKHLVAVDPDTFGDHAANAKQQLDSAGDLEIVTASYDSINNAIEVLCVSEQPKDIHMAYQSINISAEAQLGLECDNCDGSGAVDSGGVTPWGECINVPCGCKGGKDVHDN